MKTPSVSILIAVYNGGELLEPSLRSMAAQSFPDWEMVVVDDASTDGTRDRLEKWAHRDPRVRLITNASNKGQTACLNQGLAACRAPWVARQDADDLSCPSRLARQVNYLRRNPATVLLGTCGTLIDGGGRRIGLLDAPCHSEGIRWSLPFLNPFLHTSVVFRREVARRAGGYDERFRIAQDYDLWGRLAAEGPCANLPQRLVFYRHSESSLSKSGRDRAFAEADEVSAREAERFFARPWSPAEAVLAGEFRRGLPAGRRREFWELLGRLQAERGSVLPRALISAWHLRVAGSASAPAEVASAIWADPAFAVRWLAERFLAPSASPRV